MTASDDPTPDGSWRNGVSGWIEGLLLLQKRGDAQAGLKSGLANFKVPKKIHVIDALPRNAMGKVQKNVLRQQYAGLE